MGAAGARTGAEVVVEPDRRAAIDLAVDRGAPGDVILGVGNEPVRQLEAVWRGVRSLGAAGVDVPLKVPRKRAPYMLRGTPSGTLRGTFRGTLRGTPPKLRGTC